MKKRDVFPELIEGFDSLEAQRKGKVTLREHRPVQLPDVEIEPAEIVAVRKRFGVSQAVLARYLRVNERTLENWEQGRATPNAQARLLLRMVERYPDTFERLATL